MDCLLDVEPTAEHWTLHHAHVHFDLLVALRTRNRPIARGNFRHSSGRLPLDDRLHSIRALCWLSVQLEFHPFVHFRGWRTWVLCATDSKGRCCPFTVTTDRFSLIRQVTVPIAIHTSFWNNSTWPRAPITGHCLTCWSFSSQYARLLILPWASSSRVCAEHSFYLHCVNSILLRS